MLSPSQRSVLKTLIRGDVEERILALELDDGLRERALAVATSDAALDELVDDLDPADAEQPAATC